MAIPDKDKPTRPTEINWASESPTEWPGCDTHTYTHAHLFPFCSPSFWAHCCGFSEGYGSSIYWWVSTRLHGQKGQLDRKHTHTHSYSRGSSEALVSEVIQKSCINKTPIQHPNEIPFTKTAAYGLSSWICQHACRSLLYDECNTRLESIFCNGKIK